MGGNSVKVWNQGRKSENGLSMHWLNNNQEKEKRVAKGTQTKKEETTKWMWLSFRQQQKRLRFRTNDKKET